MPSLQIRGLPPEVYGALKRAAARDLRSLAQEAIVLLKRALAEPAGEADVDRRRALLRDMQATRVELTPDAPAPTELLRADRRR